MYSKSSGEGINMIGAAIILGVCMILAAAILTDAISFITLVNMVMAAIVWCIAIIAVIVLIVISAYTIIYMKEHIKWRK